jgi:biopolymer transport protein ExbB/TolQ
MSSSSSHRPTREGPLLVLALAIICTVCIPLWQMTVGRGSDAADWSKWTGDRVARLFLGPEQIACYVAFTWAGFILLGRYLEIRRQRRAFDLDLLPTDAGVCILPEDARLLKRQVEQRTAVGGPYILANMIRLALGKYAMSRSARDVNDTVRTQADVELGRMVSSMATVHYLAWALPAIGFLGTVRGLAMTMGVNANADVKSALGDAMLHLNVAFDCTLIALALSLVLMFPLHAIQREEEALVIDCQQYCLEHLISRLYEVAPDHAGADHGAAPVMAGPLPGEHPSPRR